MNNDMPGIIAEIVFIALIVAVFLSRNQFALWWHRLSGVHLMDRDDPPAEKSKLVKKDTGPWPWYRAWEESLIRPNDATADELLHKGKVTFARAVVWTVATSIVFTLLTSIVYWIRSPYRIDLASGLIVLQNLILAGLFSPIVYLAWCGAIHLLARLFRGKGAFRDFFVIYTTFTMPVTLLFVGAAVLWQISRNPIALLLGALLAFHLTVILPAKAAKAVYHLHWLAAFFASLFVDTVLFPAGMILLLWLVPGLIRR